MHDDINWHFNQTLLEFRSGYFSTNDYAKTVLLYFQTTDLWQAM